MRIAYTFCGLLLVACLPGCSMNPVDKRPDFVLMSEDGEQEVGDRYHKQVLEQYDVYDDPELQAYVSELGQRLAKVSHRSEIDYTFTVLDTPEINAFALPGGYIYITRGIMAYFNSEAGLAGVLGHEIGHVAARHSVKQYSASMATQVAGQAALIGAGAGKLSALAMRFGQAALIRGYGRDQELEADRLGAQYLAHTGYDPQAMLDVIHILADQADYVASQSDADPPPGYHALFDTHPDNDDRLQEVIAAADEFTLEDPHPDGHRAYLREIDGMRFRGPRSDGFVRDGAYLDLANGGAFEVPKVWEVERDNGLLTLYPESEAGVLQVKVEPRYGEKSPRELLKIHASRSRLSDGRVFEDSGTAGYTAVGRIQDARASGILRHVVVLHGGKVWYFDATVGKRSAFDSFDQDFLRIAGSLAPLDDAQRHAAGAIEIGVLRADEETTYAGLADLLPDLDNGAQRLRLLNGHWPDTPVPKGRYLKMLRRSSLE